MAAFLVPTARRNLQTCKAFIRFGNKNPVQCETLRSFANQRKSNFYEQFEGALAAVRTLKVAVTGQPRSDCGSALWTLALQY